MIALGAALAKEPHAVVDALRNYMKPAKCNPNARARPSGPGGGYNSDDVFIFHRPDMFGTKEGKEAVGNAKVSSKKVFLGT